MATTLKQNNVVLSSVGIDIGKDVFHLVGFDVAGKIVLRRKIKRLALVSELEKLPPCIIGMEACLSAHFVSRTLRKLGRLCDGLGFRAAWDIFGKSCAAAMGQHVSRETNWPPAARPEVRGSRLLFLSYYSGGSRLLPLGEEGLIPGGSL